MLAFVVPLWVLPFLPPWPVVFVALFTATFFTPLINGPIIAVLTARTPEGLRAMVMTSVISINTLAAPLGFLVAAGARALGRRAALRRGRRRYDVVFAAIVLRHREADLTPTPASA